MELEDKAYSNRGFEGDSGGQPGLPPDSSNVKTSRAKELTKDERMEKLHIIKNVFIISFAFFLLYSSYLAMSNLQSSINPDKGTTALSVVYGAFFVSSAFLSSSIIKLFTIKWTLVLCMLGYSSYIGAQFYPRDYTLIPTAILLGLSGAPMWSAACTYITHVGKSYADIVGENSVVIISKFFGLFFFCFQSAEVAGNLISSTVLSQSPSPPRTDEQLQHCGAIYCPSGDTFKSNGTNATLLLNPPALSEIYTMSSIYLVLSLLSSLIVAFFVDPLSRFFDETKGTSSSGKTTSNIGLVVSTFNHMRHPYQLLIIPLTMWSGIAQGYITAEYNAVYVTCGLGVHMVGYAMLCFGVCDAISSLIFPPLVKMAGRVPVFTLAALLNATSIIIMFTWTPHPDGLFVFFLIPALWGISDAVWQGQTTAMYGVIFPGEPEAAFSNFNMWEATGSIISYASHSRLCNTTQLFITVGFLVAGMIGYYVVEIIDRKNWLPKDASGIPKPIDKIFSSDN